MGLTRGVTTGVRRNDSTRLDNSLAGKPRKQRLGIIAVDHSARTVVKPGKAVEPRGLRRDDVVGDIGMVGAEQDLRRIHQVQQRGQRGPIGPVL